MNLTYYLMDKTYEIIKFTYDNINSLLLFY